jgi:hypothetical protein
VARDRTPTRHTGRATVETVKHWSKIRKAIGVAPSPKLGEPPARSPGNVQYRLKRYRAQLFGCCVGENTAQAAECLLRMPPARLEGDHPLEPRALSPFVPYYLGRKYSRAQGVRLPAEGAIVSHAALALSEPAAGFTPYDLWPATPTAYREYSDRRKPPTGALEAGAAHTIREKAIVPDAQACLRWLAMGFPLVIGADWPEGILTTRDDGYFDCSGGPGPIGHCVTWYDYDTPNDVAVIGNSWANARWGRLTRDPEMPPECEGYDNIGWCRLSHLLALFTQELMASGQSEAVVINTVEGWEPRVRSFAEAFTD